MIDKKLITTIYIISVIILMLFMHDYCDGYKMNKKLKNGIADAPLIIANLIMIALLLIMIALLLIMIVNFIGFDNIVDFMKTTMIHIFCTCQDTRTGGTQCACGEMGPGMIRIEERILK